MPALSRHLEVLDQHFEEAGWPIAASTRGLLDHLKLRQLSSAFRDRSRLIDESDVAIHVRLDDYRQYAGGKLLLGAQYYGAAVDALGIQPGDRIRIFSDEITAALDLLEPIARRRGAEIVEHEVVLSPSEEMTLLSCHKRIVISNSSFSWWAAFLASGGSAIAAPASAPLTNLSEWIEVNG